MSRYQRWLVVAGLLAVVAIGHQQRHVLTERIETLRKEVLIIRHDLDVKPLIEAAMKNNPLPRFNIDIPEGSTMDSVVLRITTPDTTITIRKENK